MPPEKDNTLELNQYVKSDKMQYIIYIDLYIFFYLGFLSRTFTIHRTAVEGAGYLFDSSLPLPHGSQTLRR